jgi:Zn ribbon nucleic-acid-binding protein
MKSKRKRKRRANFGVCPKCEILNATIADWDGDPSKVRCILCSVKEFTVSVRKHRRAKAKKVLEELMDG